MTDTIDQDYGADQITALEGLAAVRHRPGMYVGSTGKRGFHHLLWEIIDNSVDEAMAHQCDRIEVILNADGSATVVDNGRGIPVDPQRAGSYKGMPTVQMVMTVLHAGGKFGEGAYSFSGGLHGVGISVVNALSEWTKVDVKRDGFIHHIEFGAVDTVDDLGRPRVSAGLVTKPIEVIGKVKPNDTGTTVTFLPDDRIFSHNAWDDELITRRMRQGAFLNAGLTFVFRDERGETPTEVEYHYPNGLTDFMSELTIARLEQSEHAGQLDRLMPLQAVVLGGANESVQGEWQMCLRWFPDQWYRTNSFANGIETGNGGAHVKGYEQVLTQLMNRYARQDHVGLLGDKDYNLEATDIRSGLGVIISVKVKEPQFVGQTKDELSNDETRVMVRQGFSEQFWDWMQEHPNEIAAVLTKCIDEMRLRHRVAAMADAERSKNEKRGVAAKSQPLPSKLSDCESRDWIERELFIVEGDSAAGPTKKARDTYTQAVLPIRGKGLNIEKALASRNAEERIQGNAEIQGILATLGAGSQDLFDLDAMRYGKIIILTDADDDGAHIQLLLMTTFYRLCRPLVEAGRLYVARPPLYSATMAKGQKVYVSTEEKMLELEATGKVKSQTRFKGLGEMNFDQLGETCISPASRHLVQIKVDDLSIADDSIVRLMGGNSESKWDALQDVEITEDALT